MRQPSFPFQHTKETMERLAVMIERDLKEQVPQPGYRALRKGERGPTGKLKRSLSVNAFPVKNEEFTIAVGYEMYGNYTNFGTRQYAGRWQQLANQSLFELPNFAGYRRGSYGIRPQYWLSLSRQENRYIKEITTSLEMDFESFINNVVENLSKP